MKRTNIVLLGSASWLLIGSLAEAHVGHGLPTSAGTVLHQLSAEHSLPLWFALAALGWWAVSTWCSSVPTTASRTPSWRRSHVGPGR